MSGTMNDRTYGAPRSSPYRRHLRAREGMMRTLPMKEYVEAWDSLCKSSASELSALLQAAEDQRERLEAYLEAAQSSWDELQSARPADLDQSDIEWAGVYQAQVDKATPQWVIFAAKALALRDLIQARLLQGLGPTEQLPEYRSRDAEVPSVQSSSDAALLRADGQSWTISKLNLFKKIKTEAARGDYEGTEQERFYAAYIKRCTAARVQDQDRYASPKSLEESLGRQLRRQRPNKNQQ